MIVAAALTLLQAGRAFEAASETRLLDTARTLARAAESELEGGATLLNVLVRVPHVVSSPGAVDPWANAADLQIGGRLVEDVFATYTGIPGGEGLSPQGIPLAALRRAFRTGQPALSNLFVDPATNAPRIAIAALVSFDDASIRFAALVIPPERLVQALQQPEAAGSGLLVAVVDGQGRFVARSRDGQASIGKPVPDFDKLKATGARAGSLQAMSIEGRPVFLAFQTLKGTPDWILAVGEPLSAFRARTRAPLIDLAIAASLALLLGLTAAAWIGKTVLRPVQALVGRARQVAAGDEAAPATAVAPSGIAEFEDLRRSLEGSEQALRARAEAQAHVARSLAQSEKRYRILAGAGALVIWRRDVDGGVTATGWDVLTGRAAAFDSSWAAFDASWYDNLHPDDAPVVRAAWQEAQRASDTYDIEYRVRLADGTWHWVRSRGAKVEAADGPGEEWIGVIEDVHARREAQTRLAYLAHHDAMTGLGNRLFFQERLRAICDDPAQRRQAAVLCIDLDRFKWVNDTLGHAVGDAVLIAVTERLKACVQPGDVLARIGADEFAVIEVGGSQPEAVSSLAQSITCALAAPMTVADHAVELTVSIGIALPDEEGPDAALRNADIALDRAKRDGRGRFAFFEQAMDASMQLRLRMERDLRAAVDQGQFLLHYQPIVSVATGTLAGFEALVRWRHPERGMVPPGEFIGLAEEIGLIVPLGRWVLERACADAALWPRPVKVAVNVSPRQLADNTFPDLVAATLKSTGLSPSRLELEITESALMDNVDAAMSALLRLKMTGCAIAMDDFGTGYSSLGYLRTFPFDKVKIDRSFVKHLSGTKESSAIIRAVTGMCDSLAIISTAEGVETEEQLAYLREERCIEAQGYLFGRPLPMEELPAVFARFAGANVLPIDGFARAAPVRA
jgi:diguanylate cyclase (GGDEF)-like protein